MNKKKEKNLLTNAAESAIMITVRGARENLPKKKKKKKKKFLTSGFKCDIIKMFQEREQKSRKKEKKSS